MQTALDYLAGHWLAFGFIGAALVAFLLVFLKRRPPGPLVPDRRAGLRRPGAAGGRRPRAGMAPGRRARLSRLGSVAACCRRDGAVRPGGAVAPDRPHGRSWAALAVAAPSLCSASEDGRVDPTGAALADGFATLSTVKFVHPWRLFLLLLAPLPLLIAWRPLFHFESMRPWIAGALRTLGVVLLALALAEPLAPAGRRACHGPIRRRSLAEHAAGFRRRKIGSGPADRSASCRFINEAVADRNAGHARDRAGLIVFGKQPRLELPPSDAPRFNLTELPAARRQLHRHRRRHQDGPRLLPRGHRQAHRPH